MTNPETPAVPPEHECGDQVDVELYDWDCAEDWLSYYVECAVCGFGGRMITNYSAHGEPPNGAVFYACTPLW